MIDNQTDQIPEEMTVSDMASVTLAARKMNIGIIDLSEKDFFQFEWWDLVSGTTIIGPKNPDRQQAFREACMLLVNYLSIRPGKN